MWAIHYLYTLSLACFERNFCRSPSQKIAAKFYVLRSWLKLSFCFSLKVIGVENSRPVILVSLSENTNNQNHPMRSRLGEQVIPVPFRSGIVSLRTD